MKMILSLLTALALTVSQTSFAQAKPIETTPRPPEAQPTRAFMPDSVSLLSQLTTGDASGGLGLEAAFANAQEDKNPPIITFFPPVLPLFPTDIFPDQGTIIGVGFDLDVPFIVNFGTAAAIGYFNVFATELTTFFDYVDVTLPDGQLALGIGFFAVGNFLAYVDYYHALCPCGSLDIFALDFGGNTAIGSAFVVAYSY